VSGDPPHLCCNAPASAARRGKALIISSNRSGGSRPITTKRSGLELHPLFHVFGLARESAILANVVNAELTKRILGFDFRGCWQRKPMEAMRIAVDAIVVLTDCDRDAVTAFIRKLYLAGVRDPKRLTFKGLQALTRN
jgi:hypothetical protein